MKNFHIYFSLSLMMFVGMAFAHNKVYVEKQGFETRTHKSSVWLVPQNSETAGQAHNIFAAPFYINLKKYNSFSLDIVGKENNTKCTLEGKKVPEIKPTTAMIVYIQYYLKDDQYICTYEFLDR